MILLHHAYGQLANRMILIIHFIAYCLDRNESLRITNFDEYLAFFDNKALKSLDKQTITFNRRNLFQRIQLSLFYRLVKIPKINRLIDIRQSHDKNEQTFDMSQLDEYVKDYTYIIPEGWLFRCTELTEKHRSAIVELFQPNEISKKKIEIFLSQLPDNMVKVGVHIRRRDYREFQGGKYFYDDATYLLFMDQFETLFRENEVQFLIFSDEPISAVIRNRKHVLVSENNFIEDFFLMSNCDYLFGPPSTFTLVAAYLGRAKLAQIDNPETAFLIDQFETISKI